MNVITVCILTLPATIQQFKQSDLAKIEKLKLETGIGKSIINLCVDNYSQDKTNKDGDFNIDTLDNCFKRNSEFLKESYSKLLKGKEVKILNEDFAKVFDEYVVEMLEKTKNENTLIKKHAISPESIKINNHSATVNFDYKIDGRLSFNVTVQGKQFFKDARFSRRFNDDNLHLFQHYKEGQKIFFYNNDTITFK